MRCCFTLAAAGALYTSFAASPAAAAGHDARLDSSACQFSSVDTLSAFSSVARGDDAREPAMNDFAAEVPAAAKGKGGKLVNATVPVYFHVVTDGVTAGPGSPAERAMNKALHKGGGNALNWYSTTAGAFLGWAYFPDVLKKGNAYLDRIVVDWESMVHTSTRYAGRYDLGKTGVHEAGHWVNLHHVFNGGCNNWGDCVADTPPQLIAPSGCPEGQNTCREPGLDSIHNYMDYSYDACYKQFTADQAARMQNAWLYWRAP